MSTADRLVPATHESESSCPEAPFEELRIAPGQKRFPHSKEADEHGSLSRRGGGVSIIRRLVTRQHDGKYGPLADRKLATHGKCARLRPVASSSAHWLRAYFNGGKDRVFKLIRDSSDPDSSTRSVFKVVSVLYPHTSSKVPISHGNTNFSSFHNGGESLHQEPPDAPLVQSCMHVAPYGAARLFNCAGGDTRAPANDIAAIRLQHSAQPVTATRQLASRRSCECAGSISNTLCDGSTAPCANGAMVVSCMCHSASAIELANQRSQLSRPTNRWVAP